MNERMFTRTAVAEAVNPKRNPMLLVLLDELEKECASTGEISAQLTTRLEPLLEIVPECPSNPQGIGDPRPTLPHALERLRNICDGVRRTNSLLRETQRRLEV